jgi:hypothetical protein
MSSSLIIIHLQMFINISKFLVQFTSDYEPLTINICSLIVKLNINIKLIAYYWAVPNSSFFHTFFSQFSFFRRLAFTFLSLLLLLK